MAAPLPPEHALALLLATGTWLQLQGAAAELQAAYLRGADAAEVEAIRQRAHDLLDAHLDHNVAAAQAARKAAGF